MDELILKMGVVTDILKFSTAQLSLPRKLGKLFVTFGKFFVVLSKFLDVEHLISLCIQIPKREDTKAAEMKITEMIHLKHTLELVAQFRSVIKEGSNPLFIMYYKV